MTTDADQFDDTPPPTYHPRQGPQRRSAAKHSTFLAFLQTSLRRTTARLRGEETAGEGVSSDDYQLGIAERNSPERRLFRSSTSVQALQAGVWSKSIQLETRQSADEDHPIMSGQSRKVTGGYWSA